MGTGIDKLGLVNAWLTRDLWLQDIAGGKRLVGASLKIQPTGLLLVLKSISAEGPFVAFVGGNSLEKIMRKTQVGLDGGAMNWRIDQYRLDSSGT